MFELQNGHSFINQAAECNLKKYPSALVLFDKSNDM